MKHHIISAIRRLRAYQAATILLVAAALISITSCGRKTMTDEEASQWIAAYTPMHIDRNSPIRIELTNLMRSRIDTARSLKGAFSFSPSVKGTAVYSPDKRFIDFVPDGSLKPGIRYECRVKMKELTASPLCSARR